MPGLGKGVTGRSRVKSPLCFSPLKGRWRERGILGQEKMVLWREVSLKVCGIMAEAWVEGSGLLLTSPMTLDRSVSSSVNGTIVHILLPVQVRSEEPVNGFFLEYNLNVRSHFYCYFSPGQDCSGHSQRSRGEEMVHAFFNGSFLGEDPVGVDRMPLETVLSMRVSASARAVML